MGRLRAALGVESSLRGKRPGAAARRAVTAVVGLTAASILLAGHTASAQSALPVLSIEDVSTPEGSPEGVDHFVSVPVTLSPASSLDVRVDYKTVDGVEGQAVAGDYYPQQGTIAFAPGETRKTIDILIDGGDTPEVDEQFTIELSSPVNATIARGTGTVTILNDDVPPPPEAGEVNVIPSGGGGQCIALKGGSGCRALAYGEQLPIEDIKYIDPRSSKVTVRSIVGIGTFYGGRFSVKELGEGGSRSTKSASAKPILVVRLTGGDFKVCRSGNRALSSAGGSDEATATKPVRRLWGKGKGRFRTRGRYASGSVRGTNWVTEDYCDGTKVRVVSGVVQVYDLVLKRWVVLKPGESYTAAPSRKRK